MYEQTFDTEWDALDREELLERAYALGVDASLGTDHEEELQRLLAAARSNYHGSLVKLAFDEGATDAKAVSADTDTETAWARLVDGAERPGPTDASGPPVDSASDGPPAALERPDVDSVPEDGRDALRLPEFLRRG